VARRKVGYVFDLEDFRELLKDIEIGMIEELKEIKEEDPEGFKEYDFRMFKTHLMDVFTVLTDFDERDILLFVEWDKHIRLTNEQMALMAIAKFYKPLKQFYDDVMRKVEKG
jgi:hypothetical protein